MVGKRIAWYQYVDGRQVWMEGTIKDAYTLNGVTWYTSRCDEDGEDYLGKADDFYIL